MTSQAYIARYPLNASGDDLYEQVLVRDGYWTEKMAREWERLTADRKPSGPMLQGWYRDCHSTVLMAWTNQPFRLP